MATEAAESSVVIHTLDTDAPAQSEGSEATPAPTQSEGIEDMPAPTREASEALTAQSEGSEAAPAPTQSEGSDTVSWGAPDTRISEVKANSRGIPAATFFENVSETCTQNSGGPDQVLKELNHLYGKYKFMENSLVQQKANLANKIPEIKNALAAVNFLVKKQEANETVETQFEVADTIYAKASVKPENRVLLWLGANVMLEYGYAEAVALLTKNLANAQTNLGTLDTDLAFLKDQITISEVNIARVHNHKVQLKQDLAKAK